METIVNVIDLVLTIEVLKFIWVSRPVLVRPSDWAGYTWRLEYRGAVEGDASSVHMVA